MAHPARIALALVAFGLVNAMLSVGTGLWVGFALALDATHARPISALTGVGAGMALGGLGVVVGVLCLGGAAGLMVRWKHAVPRNAPREGQ